MPAINGILDNTTEQVLVLNDDRSIFRGNVKIQGVLDVGLLRTTEVIADSRYEKKFLTFVAPEDTQLAGTGLLWADKQQNKQLVYRTHPDRFFLSEHIDIPSGKAYLIEGDPILTSTGLGPTVTNSNLTKVGILKSLTVEGDVNLGDVAFVNPVNGRLSVGRTDPSGLFSVYDATNDVEIIIEGNEHGNAKIGSYNNKGLDLVTGDQSRVTITASGNIILGKEFKDNTVVNVYGSLGVNVKNPKEDLEVAGNIKFQNRLFSVADRPPETGSFQTGDILWNNKPTTNKYIGWVCTSGGTPGVWEPFGLIAG